MATSVIEIGNFSAIFVGDYNQGTPLTRIITPNTQGSTLSYTIPEEYLDSVGNSVQNGRAQITVNMTFLSDTDQTIVLANGNSLATSPADSPSQFVQLALFLVHPDGAAGNHSIYIPKCYVIKSMALNYSKNNATVIPLQFIAQNRNRFVQLYYKQTNLALSAIMGSQYPLGS